VAGAVLSAPAVSRARLFCLETGEEIPANLCPDEGSAGSTEFRSEPCCEHRVQVPLAAAKCESNVDRLGAVTAVEVELRWFVPVVHGPPLAAFEVRPPSRAPLEATHILLI
jgi:hypothetical protein